MLDLVVHPSPIGITPTQVLTASLQRTHRAGASNLLGAERYLGTVLTNHRRFDDAEATLKNAERKLSAALGPDHARTVSARTALEELASARRASGRGGVSRSLSWR